MAAASNNMSELAVKLRLSRHATEELTQRAATSGQDVGTVASRLIEQAVTDGSAQTKALTQTQRLAAWEVWVAGMREWGSKNLPAGHIVDDSRESIYEGRGE
jgi:hypothetical protein